MSVQLATRRGTTNTNRRGSSAARRVRRTWLVNTFGDGVRVLCYFCPAVLTVDTVTSDRIRPGILGGTYVRRNIRPACVTCNSAHGGRLGRARQLGVTVAPKPYLTRVQLHRLIEVRCHPSGKRTYGGAQKRTVDRLAELGLVHVQRVWRAGRLELLVEPLGEGVRVPVALTLGLEVRCG